MEKRNAFSLRQTFLVLVHTGSGAPFAARVQGRRVAQVAGFVGAVFFVTFTGTLLFFRELEINRKLEDRLLDYATRETLAQPYPAGQPGGIPALPASPLPPSQGVPGSQPRAVAAGDSAAEASASSETSLPEMTISGNAEARLVDLRVDCQSGECVVKFALAPTGTRSAQGQTLVLLETEIPRIGGTLPTGEIRKRYFFHPGKETKDEISEEILLSATRKPFKFAKALQASATFKVGKLLRPLAANVYLFDTRGGLVHHERKAIDNDEGM